MMSVRAYDLLCNMMVDPMGVDDDAPRFSWKMSVNTQEGKASENEPESLRQTGYHIVVYRIENKRSELCWDSGWVDSPESVEVLYNGSPLLPRTRYGWRVRQKDGYGAAGEWSDEAYFETGLMGDHRGRWIGRGYGRGTNSVPAPLLRKTFALPQDVHRGRVYLCGLGYHVLYVNGHRAADGVLNPGVSQYDKTVYYQTVDITRYLQAGENVLGVVLGNGWYNANAQDAWGFHYAVWRSQPKLWLEAYVELTDGSEVSLVSDTSWKASEGPWRADQLRNGEIYDARLERAGWSAPGFDDSDFLPVRVRRTPGGQLKSQQFIPIRRVTTLEAKQIRQVRQGVWVYDFGENISGVIRLCAKGYRDSEIVFRYSERVNEDGMIDRSAIDTLVFSGEFQTDRYIMKGSDMELWSPEFTYHGFRYVEITGYPGEYTKEAFKADVICTDLPIMGGFRCSEPLVNEIQAAALRASRTNFHGLPTDCPHREKNGWLCDAWIAAECILTNYDPRTLYRKWVGDIADSQREDGSLPGIVPTTGWGYNRTGIMWGEALILIPWYQYLHSGDVRILEENYPAMEGFFENLSCLESDGIMNLDGEEQWSFGDWMPPGGNGKRSCPAALTETAAYYHVAVLLSEISKVLGKTAECRRCREKAEEIRKNFRRAFFTEDGRLSISSQTAVSAVLFSGLLKKEEISGFAEALVDEIEKQKKHFDTGFQGTKYLLHGLTEYDMVDLGYEMITKKDYPGFGYMIGQGATTLWENWEGDLSQNHPTFGDVSTFFYRGLAGIRPDPSFPGYRKFMLKPAAPKTLDWVDCWHESPYGRIESRWKRVGTAIEYCCRIPAGTEARLILFDGSEYLLGPGSYVFLAAPPAAEEKNDPEG